jgi:DNA-binding NarL/FixJ family response regulator
VRLAMELRPDVILMDVQLPGMSGVEATAAICAAWPAARVIILTTFDRDDYVYQGVRAGAMGFLLKDTPAENLVSTIQKVHAGEYSSSRRSPRAPCASWCGPKRPHWSRSPNASARC